MLDNTRWCSGCRTRKDVGEFRPAERERGGFFPSCRECERRFVAGPRVERECPVCGSTFAGRKDATYCSRACKNVAAQRRRRAAARS